MRTLYHELGCPYCRRTRIVLEEKGIAYESVEVDLENPPEALQERNPKGTLPTLDDEGVIVYESHIVDEYLDERYPTQRLMPRSPVDRARVRLLNDFVEKMLAPALVALRKEHKREPRDEAAFERARGEVKGHLELLAKELGEHEYLIGKYGLADIELAPWAVRLPRYGVSREDIPSAVLAWIDRLCTHAAVARQTADRVLAGA